MITPEIHKVLCRPFQPREHKFLRGRTYIREEAILERLAEVDLNWSCEIISSYTREGRAVCTMRMTVCGVSRDNVGSVDIEMTKDASKEANEAEKAAATDAFKRAARLFGIGAYLLKLPRGKDMDESGIREWLLENYGNKPPAPQPAPVPTPPPSEPPITVVTPTPTPPPADTTNPFNTNGNPAPLPVSDAEKDNHIVGQIVSKYPNVSHIEIRNTIAKYRKNGELTGMTLSQVVAFVEGRILEHRTQKAAGKTKPMDAVPSKPTNEIPF